MSETRTPAEATEAASSNKTASGQRGSARRLWGSANDLALDSLADRLVNDPALRKAITAANGAEGPITAACRSWATRAARLAKDTGTPWGAQLETIAHRAIEMTQGAAR